MNKKWKDIQNAHLSLFLGARTPRFDPSAYIKDKERRKKESDLKT